MEPDGRVAFITGASRVVGAAVARCLHAEGRVWGASATFATVSFHPMNEGSCG